MSDRYDTLAQWLAFDAATFRMHEYHQRLLLRYLRSAKSRPLSRFSSNASVALDALAGYALRVDPNVPRHQAWVLGDVTVNGRPTVVVNGMDFERVPSA